MNFQINEGLEEKGDEAKRNKTRRRVQGGGDL